MSKIDSMFKKVKTVTATGLKPIQEGMDNYQLNNKKIEERADELSKICGKCENLKIEPISFFRIDDKRIPVLDKKYCFDCGCSAPYLLRQFSKICKKW
tara:strand:+ start:12903 stop:13196 length:294 start_codon:yes stop_codon:yes gene_type:complete